MFLKIFVLACALVVSHAGFISSPATHYAVAPAALTATADNILRSPGNLAQVATQTKTIATPFSSSSKSDIRVSNPGVYAHSAPISYAAPAVTHYVAPPVTQYTTAPIAHGAPASLLGVAYSPAVAVSHMSYSSPVGISYAW